MGRFDYGASPYPVREELPAAHDRAWERLARPGAWWTGAERVAIAAEVRAAWTCPLCLERKEALSPAAVAGEHTRAGGQAPLPPTAVDAVHRITTDPGRLSRTWFESLRADGLSDGQYVELVGVLVGVVSIDRFCRGIGAPLQPLPEPQPGEPSRRAPEGLADRGAWVPMVGAPMGNVIKALSYVPAEVKGLLDLSAAHYLSPQEMMDFSRGRGALDRAQVELVAGRVSALRECFY